MFFNRKKKMAKKHIQMTDHVKLLLLKIYTQALHPLLIVKGKTPQVAQKEANIYSSYTVNRLFGDSNAKLTVGNESFFIEMDYYHQDMLGVVINQNYPRLKRLITDAMLRCRTSFEILGKTHLLENKEVINSLVRKLDLMPANYQPMEDSAFLELAQSELDKLNTTSK